MKTFVLKRFSNPAILKAMKQPLLLELLEPHADYFGRRGVTLHTKRGDAFDHDAVARVLMMPDETTPLSLVDDFFYVDEMATAVDMDRLLEALHSFPEVRKELGVGPTPADAATLVRLRAPLLLERVHAERHLRSRRSFTYFQSRDGHAAAFSVPPVSQLKSLERALDDTFGTCWRASTVCPCQPRRAG